MENIILSNELIENQKLKLFDYLCNSHYNNFKPIMKNELKEHIENQYNRIYLLINFKELVKYNRI